MNGFITSHVHPFLHIFRIFDNQTKIAFKSSDVFMATESDKWKKYQDQDINALNFKFLNKRTQLAMAIFTGALQTIKQQQQKKH